MTADSTARRVVVSTTAQIGAKVLHLGCNSVSTLAIVRYLDPARYGSYVLVMTITVIAGLVADFGLANLAVREVNGSGADEDRVLGTVVVIRCGLGLVGITLAQVALFLLHQGGTVHLATLVASVICLSDAFLGTFVVVFQLRLFQQYEAFIRTATEALETGIVLYLVAEKASLALLVLPPLLGSALGAVIAFALARRRFGLRPQFDRSRVRHLLVAAIPIGPALFIGVLYLKLDNLVLAAMRPAREVGLYGAAYQPIEYLFLSSAVVIGVVYPLLAQAHGDGDHARFVRLYRRGTEALVLLTLIVPVIMLFVAPDLVALVFGAGYAQAALPMQIFSLSLVFMTVNAWQSLVLLSGGLQSITLRYNMIALVLATCLCVGAVAVIGMIGAALAALGTALYVLYASTSAVSRRLDAHLDPARLARIAAAAVVAVGVLAALRTTGLPWVLLGAVAVVPYAGTLGLLGVHRCFREALA